MSRVKVDLLRNSLVRAWSLLILSARSQMTKFDCFLQRCLVCILLMLLACIQFLDHKCLTGLIRKLRVFHPMMLAWLWVVNAGLCMRVDLFLRAITLSLLSNIDIHYAESLIRFHQVLLGHLMHMALQNTGVSFWVLAFLGRVFILELLIAHPYPLHTLNYWLSYLLSATIIALKLCRVNMLFSVTQGHLLMDVAMILFIWAMDAPWTSMMEQFILFLLCLESWRFHQVFMVPIVKITSVNSQPLSCMWFAQVLLLILFLPIELF